MLDVTLLSLLKTLKFGLLGLPVWNSIMEGTSDQG